MKFNLPIPPFLSHLKVDERGYPIPYFVAYIDGKPDFRIADAAKQKACLDFNKCWICGNKLLKGFYYFIAGQQGLQNSVSTDTAMHRLCAEFSLKACPHMYFEKADRREAGEVYKGLAGKDPTHIVEKPKEIFLVMADTFKIINHPSIPGSKLVKYRPQKVSAYRYDNGILTHYKNI